MTQLCDLKCQACRGGVPPLKGDELHRLYEQIEGWDVVEDHHLIKTYTFPDFAQALAFVNRIGAVAEEQNHHPWIELTWGEVTVEVFTHKIDGLTESDFILAAKVDRVLIA